MEDFQDLLKSAADIWSKNENEKVRRASSLLYEALEVNQYTDVWNDKKGYKCSPPILTYTSVGKENHLLDKISELNFKLSWKIPLQITHGDANKLRSILGGLDNLKSAMIVGSPEFGAQFYSNKIYVGLVWLAPGTNYPAHAHHATEFYHIISGTAKWGPTENHLVYRRPGDVFVHNAAQSHMMVVPKHETMLALYAWIGNIDGEYWWCDNSIGLKYTDVGSAVDAQEYYDNMAEDYEKVVRAWGYNMPELVADKVVQLTEGKKVSKILDIGCGDGLVAEALKPRGFSNMIGLDISEKMVKLAKDKNIYKDVFQADLMKPIPLPSKTYDVLTCVGVTTYIEPLVIRDWCKVVKKDGYLVFTVKSAVLNKWKTSQDEFEKKRLWKLIHMSEPLHYLPTLRDPSQEKVFIFVYQNCQP